MATTRWRRVLIVPALLVGVGLFLLLTRSHEAAVEVGPPAPVAVRIVTVAPAPLAGRAEGFGRVRAARRWEGVSEVEGRVTEIHEALAEGAHMAAGTVYGRIDPRDYEIAKARAEAALESASAALAEIDTREEAAKANLILEGRIKDLAAADLERKRALMARGTNAQIAVDQAERDLVNQTRKVQELNNEIALYAVQRRSAEATLHARTVDLEEAERNLANTILRVPFDARVVSKTLETGEYVRPGDRLVQFDDVAAAEVTVEVQPSALRGMVAVALEGADVRPAMFADGAALDAILGDLHLTAKVFQTIGEAEVAWPAQVLRTDGSIDETTGTVGVIVRVDDPDLLEAPREGPPLSVGTFVRVVFTTRRVSGLIGLPREALNRDRSGTRFVYVAEVDDTLGRRDIDVAAPVNGTVIVTGGLAPGDRVLLSSPQPPILGMPILPVMDMQRVAQR
ncbi:MAG: hypothetical protein AAGD34_19400 [Pseudomonadota bacterium]